VTRRCLVTGGSGFVGRALVAELQSSGWDVLAPTRAEWDAAGTDVPDAPWSEIDAVAHLATATTGPDVWAVNAEATRRLGAVGVRRFVFVSSGDALGDVAEVPDESTPPGHSLSAYGAAKAAGEEAALDAGGVVVRLFHPYGPGGERFLVNRVVARVAAGEPVTVEGDDGIPLNPPWVEDVAVGLRLAVESDAPGVFHLAGPDLVTLRGLAEVAGEVSGTLARVEPVAGQPRPFHAGRWEHTARVLGYRPSVSLREGIGRLLS